MPDPPNVIHVLRSISDPSRYYTGVASDVDKRLGFHNAGLSAHTSDAVPWQLIVSISFANSRRAIEFEKYLKSGSGRAFAKRQAHGVGKKGVKIKRFLD
jgi:putative endonuclease